MAQAALLAHLESTCLHLVPILLLETWKLLP